MYKNTIRFKTDRVVMFLTSEECFTPSNPVYSEVQKTLIEMGYVEEDNHRYKGCLGDLHFTYEEIEMYSPIADAIIYEQIKHNRMILTGASGFIGDLEYIFTTGVQAKDVNVILK